MKKNLWKLIVILIAIIGMFFTYKFLFKDGGAERDGSITFILRDEAGNIVIDEKLDFLKEKSDGSSTTLLDILRDHYEIVCRDSFNKPDPSCQSPNNFNGHVILSIESVSTDFEGTYLAHYQNGTYTARAIDKLKFNDGDVIEFRVEEVN